MKKFIVRMTDEKHKEALIHAAKAHGLSLETLLFVIIGNHTGGNWDGIEVKEVMDI